MKLDKMRIKSNQKGFTLIELMIVIAIIGILAAVAIPNYIAFKNKAYCTATVNDTLAIGVALADYFAIPGTFTANTTFTEPTGIERPFLLIGGANTLPLSVSTTGASATKSGSSYILSITEGAGNCPIKVISANSHWSGGGGTAAVYTITL